MGRGIWSTECTETGCRTDRGILLDRARRSFHDSWLARSAFHSGRGTSARASTRQESLRRVAKTIPTNPAEDRRRGGAGSDARPMARRRSPPALQTRPRTSKARTRRKSASRRARHVASGRSRRRSSRRGRAQRIRQLGVDHVISGGPADSVGGSAAQGDDGPASKRTA